MTSTMIPVTTSSTPSMPLNAAPKSANRPAGPATFADRPGVFLAWARITWTPSPSALGSVAANCRMSSAAWPSLL